MRMLVIATTCNQTFNALIKDGTAGAKLNKVVEACKPESIHFTEIEGQRTAVMIIDLADASKIPSIAEPWFLTFNAKVKFHPVMTPQDLQKAGLDALGKQWA
jgi:hypothetical protein